ncbi:MAG: ATP/GTP-binding protein [Campylobacter sp.]|nr:ATP/GTP-binding protein [Campylobacter sp.]
MNTNLTAAGSYNNMDFQIQTSSGDKLSLSMFHNQSLKMQKTQGDGFSSQTLTLSRAYGYEFEYEGNGLDANDIKEIQEAMKLIQPSIDKFMENIQNGFNYSNGDIENLANELKKDMPQSLDLNKANAISKHTLDLFDRLLEQHKADQQLLEKTKRLFDTLLDDTNKFSYYV